MINNYYINRIAKPLVVACYNGYKDGVKSIVEREYKFKFNDSVNFTFTGEDLDLMKHFQLECFSVACVGSYELQERLKKLAVELMRQQNERVEGLGVGFYKTFAAKAKEIIADYVPVGGAERVPPESWIATNLRTAISSSYHAAEWVRLQKLKDIYPAYRYRTMGDNKVRPEHQLLEGRVFWADDPIWLRILPPNGWNCRCYIEPISALEINNGSVVPESRERTAEETREIIKQGGITPEFDRNSGVSKSIWGKWLAKKFADMPDDVREDLKKKIKEFGREINNKLPLKVVEIISEKIVLDDIRYNKIKQDFRKISPELGDVPNEVLVFIAEHNIQLKKITRTNLHGQFSYNRVTREAIIKLNPSAFNLKRTLYHELGHAIDFILKPDKIEFRNLLRSYQQQVAEIVLNRLSTNFNNDHDLGRRFLEGERIAVNRGGVRLEFVLTNDYKRYIFKEEEIFADAFAQFKVNPELFKTYATDFYLYFKNLNLNI